MVLLDKENRRPYQSSFAKNAAKKAISKTTNTDNICDDIPNQIDKVVESVANATKRLSQQSAQSSLTKSKVENRVGPWRLGRTLGKGSTGRVRLAKHTTTGQLAAIKIVPKNILELNNNNNNTQKTSAKPNNKKKRKQKIDENGLPYGIEREIIIMKLISHPNLMALYDVWENKNELYLVLEYVEGGELFDFLINNGILSESDAVKYFKMIISGVAYCHKFNICHRDLKPENILLDKNGKIKIADFGMAALETQQKLLETSCGSPHYASPEIVTGANYHGSPSDVWSCGVILYALLTGHLPFDDPNIRQLLLKVQSGKFHMPSNLSNEAKDLIWLMLRVNPNERIKINDIFNHPLLLKYNNQENVDNVDEIDNKLNHLDISKPIINIDDDILNNLQTLWHGLPKSQIIENLQNNDKNPEKMFYYLLENYKLTHLNDSTAPKPNLKHSISKTALYQQQQQLELNKLQQQQQKKSLPRSTSTVITTIEDKNGKVLKSQVQELKPRKKKSSSSMASRRNRGSNRKIVASTSFNKSVSFNTSNISRDTSALTLSIVNMNRNLSIHHDKSLINVSEKVKKPANDNSLIIDNSDISNSRSFTVNPKDLPELPDLQDYKYLVKTIFDNDFDTSKENKSKSKSKIENDSVILNITNDLPFPDDDYVDVNSTNYSLSFDIRHNSTDLSNSQLTKLELLKKELSLHQPNGPSSLKSRNFSNLKSIRSTSTRRLNTFLNKEYKNVKIDEFNMKNKNKDKSFQSNNSIIASHNHEPSADKTHKPNISIDSKCVSNEISDASYSLHSAVEVKIMSPTEEAIRNMSNVKVFEDAENELVKDKSLLSDEELNSKKNGLLIYRNVVPNINHFDPSNTLIKPSHSIFEDADELKSLKLSINNVHNNDEAFESDITGSLYTSLEEQPGNNSNITLFSNSKKGLRNSMSPAAETELISTNPTLTYTKSPVSETFSSGSKHPYRGAITMKENDAKANKEPILATSTTPQRIVIEQSKPQDIINSQNTTTDHKPIQKLKQKNKSNWFKKIVSVFKTTNDSLKSTSKKISNNLNNNSNKKSPKFAFKFNKSKYSYPSKSNIFKSEYLLESDKMTRALFINTINTDSRTSILKLVNSGKDEIGGSETLYNYTFEIKNLHFKINIEIVDKFGSEFGFGGCYIKLIKIQGMNKTFNYWYSVFRDLIGELESNSEVEFDEIGH